MSNRTSVIQEIKREQTMRRKVWKMSGGFFTNIKERTQYDNLQMAHDVLSVMTDGEFERYKQLVARKQSAENHNDKKLF